MPIAADYYDGRSSRCHRVTLQPTGEHLAITGEGISRVEPVASIRIGERLGRAPRRLEFADGASCEVADHEALEQWLRQIGRGESRLVSAQFSPTAIVTSLIAVIVAGLLFWWQGMPRLSDALAAELPAPLVTQISEHSMEWLDGHGFKPSALTAERRQSLTRQYRALRLPEGGSPTHPLLFRSSPLFGANALTLPDGRIVLLDELVALAADDEEILAVLGHELGHGRYRHGLKALVRHTLFAALGAWWFGDVSNLLATAPVLVAGAQYSQELERQADDYGIAMLVHNRIPVTKLADALEKLEAAAAARKGRPKDKDWFDYLASHPATDERLEHIRAAAPH